MHWCDLRPQQRYVGAERDGHVHAQHLRHHHHGQPAGWRVGELARLSGLLNALPTASPVAGGSVSCTPNPVHHGSSSTCTATANVGYNFSSFSGDCTGATCVLNNVTTVKAVTATFLVNTPPVASNVGINGSLQISRILTGRYTYSDAQNDPQGISTFRWMRDSQSSGATKVAVPGATSISYAVVSIAQSRYLFFCVTPVATSGVTTGVEVCSSAVDTELGNPPPPPPVFPPGPFPWAGMVTAPTVLDLHTEKGTATMVGVASVLERVLSPGLRFVGQSSLGIVVMAAPNGQNYVFAPLAVQFNDPRADGLYPVGNAEFGRACWSVASRCYCTHGKQWCTQRCGGRADLCGATQLLVETTVQPECRGNVDHGIRWLFTLYRLKG